MFSERGADLRPIEEEIAVDIEEFKATLQSIESSVPNLKRKTATELAGPCLKCGGKDRFVINDGKFLCRNCHPKFGDVIEFHAWMEGLSSSEFMKQRMSRSASSRKQKPMTNKQGAEKLQGIWDRIKPGIEDLSNVYAYLCDNRKISRNTVEKAVKEGKIKSWRYPLNVSILNNYYNDGTDPHAVAFRYDRLDNGKLVAVQAVSTTGKPLFVSDGVGKGKKFERGSKASEGFFCVGAPLNKGDMVCIVEAPINALTGVTVKPDAAWIAIGGSTMTAKFKDQLRPILVGKLVKIICCFDNDEPGQKAVQRCAKAMGREIFTIAYPAGAKDGFDINDFLKAGDRQAILDMIDNAVPVEAEKEPADEKTQSQILLEIALTNSLFHSPEGDHFARVKVGDHSETWAIASEGYQRILRYGFFKQQEKTPGAQAVSDAIKVLEGICEFENEFTQAIPEILGGIFDAVSCALRNRHKIKPERLPRMADFAMWVMAAEAESALPWNPGGFMEAYNRNRASIIETALESDLVSSAVKRFLEDSIADEWKGTASKLLAALEMIVDERTLKDKSWPKSPNSLSGRLNRASVFLEHVGIKITGGKADSKRFISIQRIRDDIRDDIDDTSQVSSTGSSLNNVCGSNGLDNRDGLDDKIPLPSVEQEKKREEGERQIGEKEKKGAKVKGRENIVQTVQTVHGHFDEVDVLEYEEVII